MYKFLNTVIRNSLEQYRKIGITWLASDHFDRLKFFCFVEIQSLNGNFRRSVAALQIDFVDITSKDEKKNIALNKNLNPK